MPVPTILVVDDEASMRKNIVDLLSPQGYLIIEAPDGEAALRIVNSEPIDAVFLDISLPNMDGFSVLKKIKQSHQDLPVVIFTAFGTSERAIEAMKSGAFDYLEKPFELDEFLLLVDRVLEYKALLTEVKRLRSKISDDRSRAQGDNIIGKNSQMQEIFKTIGRVSPTDATVLIYGESGTGKELIADAIQRHSLRKDKPYVKINCGAFSESVLESEIFGHEKGAFTGAIAQRQGRFEIADGGTVFLDEINSMPPSLQIRLLRVLQQQAFFRVGGEEPIKVDVRIIATTNKDIEIEVNEGRFRQDLFYRLNVVRITAPPLRERIDDLPLLVNHFLNQYSPDCKRIVPPETLQKLMAYDWPGNVRELENTIQGATVMTRDNLLLIEQLPFQTNSSTADTSLETMLEEGFSFKEIIAFVEKQVIRKALQQTGGNRSKAAAFLKMNRRLLYAKMKEHGIRC